MRKILWLVLLAVPVAIVVTLPARLLTAQFAVSESLEDVRGTVWNGQARWAQAGRAPMDIQWRWQGRTWQWQAGAGASRLNGLWHPAADGLHLSDITGRLEVERVDLDQWLINTRPRGYLELDIARLVRDGDRPPRIEGRVVWREARLEGAVHESLGEIAVELQPSADSQKAQVRSIQDAPVTVRGTIELGVEEYHVDLWLRARADRPDLARQLARLGEVRSDGQVRLERRGRLGW